MSHFHYKALRSSREIRLLLFLPAPEPRCQMIHVEVEKAPPYMALSYTWGQKDFSNTLEVNGLQVPIIASLKEAIDAMFVFARQRHLMFWADSICINQEDVYERSRQVRLMSTIYRCAEIVGIWLGPATDDSDLAFEAMEEWDARIRTLKEETGDSLELVVASLSPEDPHFFGSRGSKQQRAFEALGRMDFRPWWRRAWIVQEGSIAHSSRTTLFCGDYSICWTSLSTATELLYHIRNSNRPDRRIAFNAVMVRRLAGFRIIRQAGRYIGLLSVLNFLRAYECEDPRDKVYAALGMAMDINENDILPDYTKTCSEVYTDIARFFLLASKGPDLNFLGCVVRSAPGTVLQHEHDRSLPSWVPDWAYRVSFAPLSRVLTQSYHSSGVLTGICRIDGLKLHVQGIVLDQITHLSSVCEKNVEETVLATERDWAPRDPTKSYFNGQTLMQAYNHTLIADALYVRTATGFDIQRGLAIDWELIDREETEMTIAERQRQTWMLDDVKAMTYGRRMIHTSRGFMGLGPGAARVGDYVCVLLGGHLLYVLRSRDDGQFEFIGECYVHGMMDGQAVEGDISIRDFILV